MGTQQTGLIEVSRDEFFAKIYDGNLNVHPRAEPDASYWEFPGRALFGKSTPGYLCEGAKRFFVVSA